MGLHFLSFERVWSLSHHCIYSVWFWNKFAYLMKKEIWSLMKKATNLRFKWHRNEMWNYYMAFLYTLTRTVWMRQHRIISYHSEAKKLLYGIPVHIDTNCLNETTSYNIIPFWSQETIIWHSCTHWHELSEWDNIV
jgi:hypothetical protein